MSPETVLLGKRITRAREARGWSRSDLARRARVDPSYITRIEEAHYTRPSVDKVAAVAAALGVRVTDLTDPPGELPPDILAEVRDICATDAELLRAVLADVRAYPPEQRAGALEFALQSLRALRAAGRGEPANHH